MINDRPIQLPPQISREERRPGLCGKKSLRWLALPFTLNPIVILELLLLTQKSGDQEMLKFMSAEGQPVYVNPHTIVAVQKYPDAQHTTIHTLGPQSPSHFCILVNEEPEAVATQWREAFKQMSYLK
jgi:uncharacterized protein YlzI (FlbEa/FlbD family)